MTLADLIIKIRADTSAAEKSVAGFGSKVKGGFRKALIPATAALATLGLVGKAAFDNLQDGARNAKQTESVIASTGGAAHVTAKHVDDLAMSLRRKAGVDDDVVHAGENMLLTFTNVQNRVGKGNQIFDQATKTMLDMSHALGQDTRSSAIQLGKALNDPIKGVTALQRVGVSFTADQRKQIKSLVESGHTMEAQKLILHELNKEFGGSAANIDPMQKSMANLKLDTIDLASGLLKGLMPALTGLVGIGQQVTAWMTSHQGATKILVGVLAGLAVAVWAVNIALAANPFTLVAAALAALVIGVVVAYEKCETFRNIVNAAWNGIKAVTQAVFPTIKAIVLTTFTVLKTIFMVYFTIYKTIVMTGIHAIIAVVRTIIAVVGIVTAAFGAVKGAVTSAWAGIKGVVTGAVDAIKTAVRTGFNTLAGIVRAVAGAIRSAAGTVKAAFQPILDVLHSIESAAHAAASAVSAVANAAGKVKSFGGKVGGLFHAQGISNYPGGMSVVGEHGPELVNLPKGSSIFSNSTSKRMLASGGGDGRTAPLIGQVVVQDNKDIEVLAQRVARVLAFQS